MDDLSKLAPFTHGDDLGGDQPPPALNADARKRRRNDDDAVQLEWACEPQTGLIQHMDGCSICEEFCRHQRKGSKDPSFRDAAAQQHELLHSALHCPASSTLSGSTTAKARLHTERNCTVAGHKAADDECRRLKAELRKARQQLAALRQNFAQVSRSCDDLRRQVDQASRDDRSRRDGHDRLQ